MSVNMSSIDFDDVLHHIGDRGLYQQIMYYLLCIPATIPAAFLAFSQVFVSASPEHWCRVPSLDRHPLAADQQKALAIPYTLRPDGRRQYSRCYMYDVNFTALLHVQSQFIGPDRQLPLPDSGWNITKCLYGWNYDRKDYDSTLVTEVRHWLHLSSYVAHTGTPRTTRLRLTRFRLYVV
jgi:hypothetical protein